VFGRVTKKRDHAALDLVGRKSEVRVGDDVAGRLEHARILPKPRLLYKRVGADDLRQVTNPSAASASAPPFHDVEFRVRYAETDQMGVVYHTNYLVWCEVGRTDFIRARGMSYADIERAGVGLAVSELSARFHGAARYDDLIRVRTTLADVRSRGITFDYLITRAENGERLVSARTALVSIDAAGRLVALPPGVRSLFEPR
jgi:acyl-CoA thioester hydrolase